MYWKGGGWRFQWEKAGSYEIGMKYPLGSPSWDSLSLSLSLSLNCFPLSLSRWLVQSDAPEATFCLDKGVPALKGLSKDEGVPRGKKGMEGILGQFSPNQEKFFSSVYLSTSSLTIRSPGPM